LTFHISLFRLKNRELIQIVVSSETEILLNPSNLHNINFEIDKVINLLSYKNLASSKPVN